MSREKIAFVCQRYGFEVNGGAELYCRQWAEKLSELYDVEVYTTCAVDYVTWTNEYTPGTEMINGVKVHRFICKERDPDRFAKISQIVMGNSRHTSTDERKWIKEQGPVCNELLQTLKRKHRDYKVVIFMTYLYYLTAIGLPMNFRNAILIPTVHDEPPVYIRHYDKVFRAAKAFVWNTAEEKKFAEKRFPEIKLTPGVMAGIGIEGPQKPLPELPDQLCGQQYITYAGRIDKSKGCGEMFNYFIKYKELYGGPVKLVLMGKPAMPIPDHPDIINLGFVTEEIKFAVMKSAIALVLFSHFESLSMVLLESMLMGRPVLVSEKCDVLKGHCVRSNAGLYFDSFFEFVLGLEYLMNHPDDYREMCANGIRYVQENYQWDVLVERFRKLIDEVGT